MSVTSSRWSATNSSMNRYKATSSKSKSSLLGENVKNYPHRESLVKKSSPYKSSNNTGFNLATSSLDSNQVNKTLKNFPRGSTYASSELLSELSQLDSPSKTGTILTTATTTTTNKPTGKRGSLLGPFKFMTSELEDHKLQHYNKGHLETVLKQLDLLQCLLVTKFQEERHENETQVMKAWMAVNEKEEEAFTISIKSRTVEEVHKIHHRLVEMEKNMEKVCESLAPTFEKFASFNELKVAQKETENYVKSIKKFNVRTKINQEYSERILKLEKSIDFLERTNEKSNRMVRTPIIEQAKRIDSAVFQRPASPTDSVTSSGSYKKLNHSQSWTNNKAMEALSSKSNDSTEREKAAGIALELEVPPKSENTTTAGNSVVKSPPGKPPIPFHERVSRPSWIKEKTEETTSSEAPNVIVLSSPGKLSSRHTSWIKDKDSLSAEDANHSSTSTSNASVTSISSNSTSTSISSGTSHVLSEPASSASTVVPDDLAAVAMGITATSSEVVVETKAPATPSKADDHLISSTETTLVEKKVVEISGSNSSSVAGSPSGAGKKSTVTEDGPNLSTISKTEKVVVEKKVLSRASWIKKEGEDATNSLPPLPATPNSSVKPLPFPDAVSSLSHSNSTSEADNANKLNRSIYVPKPDSKLAPPAEIPPSTVVKSIVSQINVSKTLNSSFYEKKLQQSGSPTNRSGQNLPKILEGSSKSGDDLNLTPAIELKSEHKKSWKELAEPLQLPVPPPVAPIIPASTAAIAILAAEEGSNNNSRSNSRGYHRRTPSNGSSSSSKYSPVDSVLVLESTMSSQPHPEASKSLPAKNDFGAKSWREFSKSQSNSNETAQISTYEAANGQKKEEGIAIRAASNYSTGLSAERLPTPNSAGPTSAFTRRPSFSTNKDEGANVSGKFNTSTGSSPTTPRFQPKLSTNFMDVKTSPSGSPTAAPAVTTQSNPSTIGGPSAFAAGTPPRITGSRGLISAISLNRQKAEATAGSSITNTGPSELPPTSRTFTTINTTSAAQADKKVIPTRNSLDLKVTDSQYKASPTTTSQAHVGKEFELEMENVPTEIMSRPPKSGPTSPRHSNTSTPGPNVPSGASASNDEMETGSAMSGVTIESASGKKKRLTVKGMVKRVNSLFRTASSAKVEEPVVTTTTTTITEQNLTKQQMAYVQEKRQSFIEKKIDADTTIVTNTPVIKANQPSVDNDFSFIEHLGADVKDDDLSSIDHQSSMDHQSEEQQKMEQQVIMSETSSQQPSSSSAATGKSSKSISKRISGLVKKTSSIFSKFTGAPEPPPRPENLPPANSASTSSHQAVGTASGKPPAGPSGSKKVGGIAMSPSDSFDVPAMTHLREMEKNDPLNPNRPPSMEVRPILKNGPNRIDSERSLPVETSSLGTIDKIIQQQQGTAVVDEESSLTTDDKFDVNGAPKPKKFKPVKFFKKTFTSMSKMI